MAGILSSSGVDPWVVTPMEKAKFEQQFALLEPVNGFVTGEQAKKFLLQSQLPSLVLANIWTLAVPNLDGKMDRNGFIVAMKLIQMKLKGFEVPQVLPPSLKAVAAVSAAPYNATGMMGTTSNVPYVPAIPPATNGTGYVARPQTTGTVPFALASQISTRSASPIEALVQRSSSVASQESPTGVAGSPMLEWAVPHASKLKYTQIFNTNDRAHSGFLSGPQARTILTQTGLHNTVLAKIWALADIDGDGRLTCEEFCVAMHLAEGARAGDILPTTLPPDLVPPSFRKKRSTSLTSGSVPAVAIVAGGAAALSANLLDDLLSNDINEEEKNKQMATFEDKRRENFEKGQAELEKRRQTLLENQRKEQEERERKEREEMEHRERIRQEQERRRQMELEKQLAKQREIEQEKEEQRKKAMEQREAARREMERQRQLEWEKQRRQELLTQRLKEQEKVLQLKAQNQNLTMQLEQLTDKVKELNVKISETRVGVAAVKGEIDGMRETRDAKVMEMDTLTKEMNSHKQMVISLNQQKLDLSDRVNVNNSNDSPADICTVVTQSFNNKRNALQEMNEKVTTIEKNIALRLQDIENKNTELEELKLEISGLMSDSSGRQQIYEDMRTQLMELRKRQNLATPPAFTPTKDIWSASDWPEETAEVLSTSGTDAWGPEDQTSVWGTDKPQSWNDADWGASNDTWAAPPTDESAWMPGAAGSRCKVIYEFKARNMDELSIMPGDVITILENTSTEPGWLSGLLQGRTGWFPEAYVEMMDGGVAAEVAVPEGSLSPTSLTGLQETVHIVGTEMKMTLFGIQEAPESISDSGSVTEAAVVVEQQNSAFVQVPKSAVPGTVSPVPGRGQAVEGVQAQALFPWRAKKENHLTFNKGDIITVKEQQDMWWYGEWDGKHGWFPKSYVRLIGGPRRSGEITPTDVTPVEGDDGPDLPPGHYDNADNFYEAMYSYQSTEEGDLNFGQGDVIEVIKMDGEWWTGKLGFNMGIFPRNYVKKLEVDGVVADVFGSDPDVFPQVEKVEELELPMAPPQIEEVQEQTQTKEVLESPKTPKAKSGKKAEIATVIAPYAATGSEQLSLQRGQLVQIRKKTQSGWWEGELQAKGKKREVGWFPATYVRLLSSSANNSARSTPDLTQPVNDIADTREQVVALYDYIAQNDSELSFLEGNIISVINKHGVAWWKGECNGAVGMFPSTYVEAMGSQQGSGA